MCPVDEVFAHIIHARRSESAERLWQIRAALAPHMEATGQKQLQAQAAAIADCSTSRRTTAYDLCDTQERIRMIGGDYRAAGQAFLAAHPEQVLWLDTQGVTLDEAAEQSDRWIAAQLDWKTAGTGD